MKNQITSFATFCATIIGVGLFGLPFAASKIGYYPMLVYFGVLTIASILVNQIYAEICLRTSSNHRLPGFAGIYLGKRAKIISIFSTIIGLLGSNLAYIVVGGTFLFYLLNPVFGQSETVYIIAFFVPGAILALLDSKSFSRTELGGLVIISLIVIFMLFSSLPKIDIENMLYYDFSLRNLFLPYGVILFSLSGMSIIPEVIERLKPETKNAKEIIALGIVFCAAIYIVFTFLVLGVTGKNTTEDALTGLNNFLGNKILIAGYALGVLATFTSYISSAITIKKIFIYDINFKPLLAWGLAISIPIMLFLFGVNDFIMIISFVGAVTMGIDSFMVFLIYRKALKMGDRKPEFELKLSPIVIYSLGAMFLFGAGLEIFFTVFK